MGPLMMGLSRTIFSAPPIGAMVVLILVYGCRADDGGIYRGLYTKDLTEAHLTTPRRVSATGEHLTHDLTTFHPQVVSNLVGDASDMPSDLHEKDPRVHFNVTINQVDHLLVLRPASRHFLSTGVVVERRKGDASVQYKPSAMAKGCHYQGVVRGDEQSRVAVSACNGLAGMIHTKNGRYFIEPTHHSSKIVGPGHKHLVYKRSAVTSNHPKKRRRRKRKRPHSNCGTREPKKMTELEWHRQIGKVKVQEKKLHNKHKHNKVQIPSLEHSQMKKMKYKQLKYRTKRSISKEQFVETLIVADASMVEFHQDGDIETYILTIMNMVSSFYLDPSIGNFINIVVVKIILIDEEPGFNVTTNADTTLKNFCKWQKNLNPGNESHPHHHDVAILITRKDICSGQDQPCGTLGVAHIGGMCRASRSCSVNEDNGITAAHTIAHEMGHNFGMLHDNGKTPGCSRRDGPTVHIMTPSFEADTVSVSWSNCSRRDITNFLDKGLGDCLQDAPSTEEPTYSYPELPAGAVYNADYQCRFQFGVDDASVCAEPPDEICQRLWCTVNETCTTLLRPAAPGTHCGKHKWCQEQKCVAMMEPPVAIDGGWGEWSAWSACSRTCGSGVAVMERECDHPAPKAGGRFCVGERKRYRICNSDPCPEDQPTFRALQCSWYNNRTYEGKKYQWQPYFDQGDPCQLYCSDANETVIVPWGDYAADGTPCNVVSRDVCISGICKRVGCDWVVESSAQEDECGICQGDGTKCEQSRGDYTKQSYSPGYREVAVIPKGARNIRVEEKGHSENFISIGSALEKKFYLNGKRHITLPGEYKVAGTQALYERDNQLEKIRIPGPILEPIVVYIFFRGKVYNPGVEYKYSIWKPETTKQVKYSWILGEWSQCSATCGGGTQHRQPLCQESTVSSVASELERPTNVDEAMCEPQEKPQRLARACNDDPCPYYWWVGPWQSCSVTCASEEEKAVRRRSVMCVDGQEMALPDQYCDRSAKPQEYDACRRMPVCENDL